jgi:hypothetical protein
LQEGSDKKKDKREYFLKYSSKQFFAIVERESIRKIEEEKGKMLRTHSIAGKGQNPKCRSLRPAIILSLILLS